jgi:hypothetical protein
MYILLPATGSVVHTTADSELQQQKPTELSKETDKRYYMIL